MPVRYSQQSAGPSTRRQQPVPVEPPKEPVKKTRKKKA